MIDNYIATSETKWAVPTGLVLLLPHGYDGNGAEHSSARVKFGIKFSFRSSINNFYVYALFFTYKSWRDSCNSLMMTTLS